MVFQVESALPSSTMTISKLSDNGSKTERLRWYNTLGTIFEPFLRRPLRNSNRELKYQRRELEELAPLLEQVTCPVIIVHGTDDHLVPYANAEYLRGSLTGAASVELVALEGVDHFLIWTEEEIVRDTIRSLVEAGSPGDRAPSR